MTTIKEVNNCIILSEENKQYLGLKTNLTVKGTTRSNFSNIRNDKGYILKDSGLEEYTLPEIAESEGKVVIYSKDVFWDIKPLITDSCDIDTVVRLISLLIILKENGVETDQFALNLFYTNENNEIFILPPKIIYFLNERSTLKSNEELVEKYSHPDLTGERAILFAVGILLYQITTSHYPVNYTTVEELRDKIRRKRFIQPRWKNVLLSDNLNKLLLDLLNKESELTLKKVLNSLKNIKTEGLYREVSNIDALKTKNTKREALFTKRDHFRASLIKNRGKILLAGILTAIAAVFFGTIIINSLKPPLTAGFTKDEVVHAYFKSFNTIDTFLIEDVLKEDVRKADIREITSLHITMAYRGQTEPERVYKKPAEWPLLTDEEKNIEDVFGITNIEVEKIDEYTYKVKYDKWYSTPEESEVVSDYKVEVYIDSREEIFTLEQTKHSYVISDIKIVKEQVEKIW